MPKIRVTTVSSIVHKIHMDGEPTYHSLCITVYCDTDVISFDSFEAMCSRSSSPNATNGPANVSGDNIPCCAKLQFLATQQYSQGTSFTLTLINSNPNETWTFEDGTTTYNGTINNSDSTDVTFASQAKRIKRSVGQRIRDFFKRLFS
ncbi:MAG: hypothetical protein R3A50_07730 [Saprospiraceae bacterium]